MNMDAWCILRFLFGFLAAYITARWHEDEDIRSTLSVSEESYVRDLLFSKQRRR